MNYKIFNNFIKKLLSLSYSLNYYVLFLINYKSEIINYKQKLKKWLYTSNHKKIGIQYFYYSLITAMLGSYFATCID
jgi:hypothetical protein